MTEHDIDPMRRALNRAMARITRLRGRVESLEAEAEQLRRALQGETAARLDAEEQRYQLQMELNDAG